MIYKTGFALTGAILATLTTAHAALPDFMVTALPNSNLVNLGSSNPVASTTAAPAAINNDGLLIGMRQTSAGAFPAGAYIYDTQSQSYLAENIGNFLPLGISQQDYFGYEIKSVNGTEHTLFYRCPLGELSFDAGTNTSTNPGCVELDSVDNRFGMSFGTILAPIYGATVKLVNNSGWVAAPMLKQKNDGSRFMELNVFAADNTNSSLTLTTEGVTDFIYPFITDSDAPKLFVQTANQNTGAVVADPSVIVYDLSTGAQTSYSIAPGFQLAGATDSHELVLVNQSTGNLISYTCQLAVAGSCDNPALLAQAADSVSIPVSGYGENQLYAANSGPSLQGYFEDGRNGYVVSTTDPQNLALLADVVGDPSQTYYARAMSPSGNKLIVYGFNYDAVNDSLSNERLLLLEASIAESPCDTADTTISEVNDLALTIPGLGNSLQAKLDNIAALFNAGNYADAIDAADSLRNQVNAQAGKKIDQATADAILALLGELDAVLEEIITENETCQ